MDNISKDIVLKMKDQQIQNIIDQNSGKNSARTGQIKAEMFEKKMNFKNESSSEEETEEA